MLILSVNNIGIDLIFIILGGSFKKGEGSQNRAWWNTMLPLACYQLRMSLSPSHLPFNVTHINSCHTHSTSSYMSSLLTFSSHYDSTVLTHRTEHSYNTFHMHKRQPVKLSGHTVIQATVAKKEKIK
jgi:hypothetical protein